MSNKVILYLTFVVLIGIGILLFMNTASSLGLSEGRYISGNDIRGMAIEVNRKLWTLNFDQQKEVIEILNRAKPLQNTSSSSSVDFIGGAGFDKLVIYRFNNQPDINLIPIGYVSSAKPGEENLEFNSQDWNPNGPLIETSNGKLKAVLDSLYDHN